LHSGAELFDLLVKEVVREMTLKAGQKCTTIRRVFGSTSAAQSLWRRRHYTLSAMKVGNPRNPDVKVGPS